MATQTQQVSHAAPHGVKRAHDEDPDNTQRLAKRFHLLNIENQQNGKLWVQPQAEQSAQPPSAPPVAHGNQAFMEVDDTKDRVYIHDLDAELANVSDTDDEERVIFLPDIERRLSRVPHRVLADDRSEEPSGQEMILYKVPHSLTVPAEHDNVRKAIIEARTRAREQQQRGDVPTNGELLQHGLENDSSRQPQALRNNTPEDPDAMDLG